MIVHQNYSDRIEKAIRRYCAHYPTLSRDYVHELVRRRALAVAPRRADLVPTLNVPPELLRSSNRGR
jgi:hypothetical protein